MTAEKKRGSERMTTKGITEKTEPGMSQASWLAGRETAPSILREDQPTVARVLGMVGLMLVTVGCAVLVTLAAGYASRVPLWLGGILFVIGLAFMLFHAARDPEMQIRRAYGILGFLCVLTAAGFLLTALARGAAGERLSWIGYIFLTFGLFFLLPFTRNETEAAWRTAALSVVGGVGALLALAGFLFSNIAASFLLPTGLILILMGFLYLWAFAGLSGTASDLGYKAGIAIGILGGLAFLVALVRSVIWGWIIRSGAPSYLSSAGALLMVLGLLYVCLSAGICSDSRLVVLTRRELGGFFYSPIAYIVFFGTTFFGGLLYGLFVWQLIFFSERQQTIFEPIVRFYVIHWVPVLCVTFVVPVLTMRLLSEEHRSGTLEVLLTAPVNEAAVVLSKFLAALVFFMVVFLPWGLLLVDLRVEGGEPFDYRPLISFFIALLFSGAGFLSMGLFFSSLTRNQIGAAILTFMGMLLLFALFFVVDNMAEGNYWKTVLTQASYLHFWMSSLSGKLAARSLILNLSACAFWLFLTIKILEARKWK
jgi:ABC-2 type transport system permease protein